MANLNFCGDKSVEDLSDEFCEIWETRSSSDPMDAVAE